MKKRIIITLSLFALALAAIFVIKAVIAAGTTPVNPYCTKSGSSYCSTGNTSSSGPCAPGTYSSGGASGCTTCPANYYCPGGSDKIACAAGTVSPVGSISSTNCISQQCPGGTTSGWSYSAINYGATGQATKGACYHTNGGYLSATANCSTSGVITITGAGVVPSCYTGYRYTSGSWYESTYGCYYVCMQNCAAGSLNGYSYNALESGGTYGSQSVSKIIANGSCTATASCMDGTVTISGESCTCNAGYYVSGTSCVQCPAGSYCTGGVQYSCPPNETSSAGVSSSSSCYCINNTWASCVYPTCNPAKYTGTRYYDCGYLSYPDNGCELSHTYSNQPLISQTTLCCGDGFCNSSAFGGSETATSCPADCVVCGDGICNVSYESWSNCYQDCGGMSCGSDSDCIGYYGSYCPTVGYSGGYCTGYGSCSGYSSSCSNYGTSYDCIRSGCDWTTYYTGSCVCY